jgi:hypothetical protein
VETGRASPKVAAETEESPEGVLEEPQQEVPREAPQTSPEPSGPPTYGRGWTEQDVLWAVSEKWNGQWQLPRKDNASRGLFASTVLQESEDRPWRLVFAETERLQPDDQGSVPLQQSLSLARGLNADILATGTARVTGEGEAASVKAHVSFFEVVSGRELGIIEEALRMGEAFYGEKLIELAAVVSVRFDRILQEASRSTAQDRGTVPAEPPPKQPRADNESRRFDSASIPTDLEPQEPGRWIVVLRSQEPYRFWEELERSLRERFGGMRVESFEMRAGESRAHLEVPGSGFLEGMRQARLSGGYEVEVLAARPEAGLVVITFRKGADSMPEASRP